MTYLRLSRDVLRVDFAGYKVWYDEATEQLILLKNGQYHRLRLTFGSSLKQFITWPREGSILDVKLSFGGEFMAIQRNDTMVEIINLLQPTQSHKCEEVTVSCRQKKGNSILRGGVIWLENPDNKTPSLVLVTKFGMELYKVSVPKDNQVAVKLVSGVKHHIHCFWYLPSSKMILLASNSGVEMRPYLVSSLYPIKLAKFTLPSTPLQRDVVLVNLYGKCYCAHIDSVTLNLRLFRIERETTECTNVLRIFGAGSFGVSVIDNLLCIHNMDAKVSLLYDIMAESNEPVVHPLSISFSDESFNCTNAGTSATESVKKTTVQTLVFEGNRDAEPGIPDYVSLSECDNVDQREKHEYQVQLCCTQGENETESPGVVLEINDKSVANMSLEQVAEFYAEAARARHSIKIRSQQTTVVSLDTYSQNWVFLPPNWVLDARVGRIWVLKLDLESITKRYTNEKVDMISAFLLRRKSPGPFARSEGEMNGYAKLVFLDYLLVVLSEVRNLHHCSQIFKVVNDAYQKRLEEENQVAMMRKDLFNLEYHLKESPLEVTIPESTADEIEIKTTRSSAVDVSIQKGARCLDGRVVILQLEMYCMVFAPLINKAMSASGDARSASLTWASLVVMEYLRTLQCYKVGIAQYLYELLACLLVKSKNWDQLHRVVQYHLPRDSKTLASILTSVAKNSPAVFQVGLDMYHRLRMDEQVVHFLLRDLHVYPALRLIRSSRTISKSSENVDLAVKCFECATQLAIQSKDDRIFSTLHSFIISTNPSIISPIKVSNDSNAKSSPLARRVEISKELSPSTRAMIQSSFGFVREADAAT